MNHKSLVEKLRLSGRNTRLNPKALALLDVLIGMAIFALIAVIAVIAIGQFRQRAFVTGATEDARTIGLAVESAATADGAYPGTDGVALSSDTAKPRDVMFGAKKLGVLTKGNKITKYTYVPASTADGAGFTLCIEHRENGTDATKVDAHAVYDSIKGGIVSSGEGACP